jgi:isopenicillin N synthase-like dioxygenase
MHRTGRASFQSIPVIDVGPLFSGSATAAREVANLVRAAATDTGFFYVRGHRVARDLMDATYMAAKYFFALPLEHKKAIAVHARSAHRGYVPMAQTVQAGRRADLKESFNFAYPFTPEHPAMASGHELIGLNQWPADEAVWRSVLERYYDAVFELGQQLLGAFALALDLPRDHFRSRYRHPLVRARLLHYPSQPGDTDKNQFGAAEHTDYGTITILWQDAVGGLEVKNRDGDWIQAPPLDDTFVINIGDMLELWSNDLFASTPHRVINTSGRERYSIAVFYDPDHDVRVECLPNCSSADNPPRHAPLVAGKYIVGRYNATYAYRQPTESASRNNPMPPEARPA